MAATREATSAFERSFLLPLKNGHNVYIREVHTQHDNNKKISTSTSTAEDEVTIIVVHGGPGVGDSSESFQGLKDLPSSDLVVFFDQLGCGKSDKPPVGDDDADNDTRNLYTLDGHVRQLEDVVEYYRQDHLRRDGAVEEDRRSIIGVLGHSWGGQIVLEWLTTKMIKAENDTTPPPSPPPIDFAIISNAPLDEARYQRHQQELRNRLDKEIRAYYEDQDNILAHETTVAAHIYKKLIGDSEVCINGEMKGWSVLGRIESNDDLLVPCLFLVTKDDTVPVEDYRQLQTKLSFPPHSVHIMERGGHGPFFGPTAEEYKRKVKAFIEQHSNNKRLNPDD